MNEMRSQGLKKWMSSSARAVREAMCPIWPVKSFPKRDYLAGIRVEPDLRANSSRRLKQMLVVMELLGAVGGEKKSLILLLLFFFFLFLLT